MAIDVKSKAQEVPQVVAQGPRWTVLQYANKLVVAAQQKYAAAKKGKK